VQRNPYSKKPRERFCDIRFNLFNGWITIMNWKLAAFSGPPCNNTDLVLQAMPKKTVDKMEQRWTWVWFIYDYDFVSMLWHFRYNITYRLALQWPSVLNMPHKRVTNHAYAIGALNLAFIYSFLGKYSLKVGILQLTCDDG